MLDHEERANYKCEKNIYLGNIYIETKNEYIIKIINKYDFLKYKGKS
jgi:hypothetical protein